MHANGERRAESASKYCTVLYAMYVWHARLVDEGGWSDSQELFTLVYVIANKTTAPRVAKASAVRTAKLTETVVPQPQFLPRSRKWLK